MKVLLRVFVPPEEKEREQERRSFELEDSVKKARWKN